MLELLLTVVIAPAKILIASAKGNEHLRSPQMREYRRICEFLEGRLFSAGAHSFPQMRMRRGYGASLVILVVYVNDIILTGADLHELSSLKGFLHEQFRIKDLVSLNYFLGIEVSYSDSGVLLHQKKFIHDMLESFQSSSCTPAFCPLELNVKLKAKVGDPLHKPEDYRCLVRKLNFLTHTRPDINFAVQHLSQFLQFPCVLHMQAAIHVLRYLRGTSDYGIFFNSSPDLSLRVFCDSDWASCADSRRSDSGFCVFLSGSLISWKSKKQSVISLSSAEAKYRAMSKAVAEVTWVSRLLGDFGVSCSSHVPLFCDNQAALHIARNPVFHERTKHIKLDCHFVRHKLGEGLLSLHHVSNSAQVVDLLTKALPGPAHYFYLRKLGVLSPSNLRGAVRIGPVGIG
uniref:Uncharacterized mitochondrial protein AtMg00810-like n=1 Tax=Nicotiana tabacum TaxID=4097 RepID=A0A1S3Z1H7_TOBAC|nr:PREDICTED: uncharacterized mitochondrial protein AtMg00810-like [Nicotiana tabacum]